MKLRTTHDATTSDPGLPVVLQSSRVQIRRLNPGIVCSTCQNNSCGKTGTLGHLEHQIASRPFYPGEYVNFNVGKEANSIH